MTWKNGSTYGTKASAGGELADGEAAINEAVEQTTLPVITRLKARSMKMIRRSRSRKKKLAMLRRASEDVVEEKRRAERVVQFAIPETVNEEEASNYARLHPFRRSSKFRQPLRRVSRAKGSPPPACLARILPVAPFAPCNIQQPNFDLTSDGESEAEEDEKLPPILLEGVQEEDEVSDAERNSDDELRDGSDKETFTVLSAVTVAASPAPGTTCTEGVKEDGEEEEGTERHKIASNPLERRASLERVRTLVRRRSSYRVSVRRVSVRRASVTRRQSVVRRASRASLRRPSTFTARRTSIVAGTVVRRRSSAVPGYIYRRRSIGARSPYGSNPLQQRKKPRRIRRLYRRPRKIVVLGEMCSGKTSLISAYVRDKFSEIYVPTILTSCMTDADVLGQKIELVVVEVAGRIDYAKFRYCAYQKMDLVILCYSADNPVSLAAIEDQWLPELKKVAPKVPYILVGTKKDLREEYIYEVELSKKHATANNDSGATKNAVPEDVREKFVTTRQGAEVAEQIGAQDFIECSAMYRDGTRDVFETAAKLALKRSPRRKKRHTQRADTCTIL